MYDSKYSFIDKSCINNNIIDNANNNDYNDDVASVSSTRSIQSETQNAHSIPKLNTIGDNYGFNLCHLARNPVLGSGIDNGGNRSRKRGSRQGKFEN